MNFLRYSNIYLVFSGLLIALSIVSFVLFGLQLGIDFTGGSILEVEYEKAAPLVENIQDSLSSLNLGSIAVQPAGEKGIIVRMPPISEDTHQAVLKILGDLPAGGQGVQERRFESIGPVIGTELQEKTRVIVGLSLLGIALYVMFAFRRVVQPVKAWNWSFVALLTLLHDIVITLGILSLLGKFLGVQIQIPILVALLTVIGYSINDTVVVFDRIRENIMRRVGFDFRDTVNQSLQQTLSRSINTSLTTLVVLLAILFFGGSTLWSFALTLIIGVIIGTYSSLFIAPVLLAKWVDRHS